MIMLTEFAKKYVTLILFLFLYTHVHVYVLYDESFEYTLKHLLIIYPRWFLNRFESSYS